MNRLWNAKVVRFKQPGGSKYVAADIDKRKVSPEEDDNSSKDEESKRRSHWIVEHIAENKFRFKSCFSGKYLSYLSLSASPILQSNDNDKDFNCDWEVVNGGSSSVVLFAPHQWSRRRTSKRETMGRCVGRIYLLRESNWSAVSEWEVEVVQTKYNGLGWTRTTTMTTNNQSQSTSLVLRWPQEEELRNYPMSTAAAGTFLVCNSGQNSNSSGSQQNGDVHVTPSTVICYGGHTYIMNHHYQP